MDELKNENAKSILIEQEIQSKGKELNILLTKRYANQAELQRVIKEIEKNNKRANDLKEYIDIGIFFSNLDIKHCPNCNHSVSENKKRIELEEHFRYVAKVLMMQNKTLINSLILKKFKI